MTFFGNIGIINIINTNIRDVVLKSQVKRLTSLYIEKDNFELLCNEDKNRIKNIYDYINNYDEKSYQLLPSYVDRDKLDEYVNLDDNYGSFTGINYNTKLDISTYKYVEKVYASSDSSIVTIKDDFVYDF